MKAKTRIAIRRYIYIAAALLAGVVEIVRNSGDITTMTWQEMLNRAIKGIPFVLMGYIAKRNLDAEPPKEDAPKDAPKD